MKNLYSGDSGSYWLRIELDSPWQVKIALANGYQQVVPGEFMFRTRQFFWRGNPHPWSRLCLEYRGYLRRRRVSMNG
jgi:hypothetical protein